MSQITTTLLARFGLAHYQVRETGNTILFAVSAEELPTVIRSLKHEHKLPLKTVTATDERKEKGAFRIYYVFGVPVTLHSRLGGAEENIFLVPFVSVNRDTQTFPSLTPLDQEFSVYEQEIKTFFGLSPVGHPQAKRIILHEENYQATVHPLLKDFSWNSLIIAPAEKTYATFEEYGGEGVYEIPVGPVHAGIIEPGHFRFSVLGEEILRLEPRLGYVHKGSEKLFETLPFGKLLTLAERISGDSSYHHALALAQAVETLSATVISERAKLLRVVYGELERLANHYNDLAFIMLDTGFAFGGSHCSRLRERMMRLNEVLTGSRFLRGVVAFGGVTKDISSSLQGTLHHELEILEKDFMDVMAVAKESDSLLNRLKGTGRLDATVAHDHGAVGIAARACGETCDARVQYPYAGYPLIQFGVTTEKSGDVYARFRVRVREVTQSFRILNQALALLLHQNGELAVVLKPLPTEAHSVGITEGFRGDIVYFVVTNQAGEIMRVKVRDPSFLNWTIMPYTITTDMVPDFPLINKSFNLSYTGNDL